ncbi:MAG: transposase [Elusimicrobia bacterium]|nr:transposase [Elusimicrobiota bacterium]
MGRRTRIHFNGAVYHVMAKGVDGRTIFVDDHDRRFFLETLERICADSGAEIFAYCLMGNHFHLAIQVSRIPLSAIMQRLLTGYVTAFNFRHNRTGHLFQARYRSKHCLDDAHLAVVIRYIHENPVQAGLVTRACDWPWSSAGDYEADDTTEVSIPADFDPWKADDEPKHARRFIEDPQAPLDDIAIRVQKRTGVTIREMQSADRRRSVVAARRALTHEAACQGHPLHAIAAWLHTTPTSVTRYSKGISVIAVSLDT